MYILPLISIGSESIKVSQVFREQMRSFETRNSENKVVSVLSPVKFGVEVQGTT